MPQFIPGNSLLKTGETLHVREAVKSDAQTILSYVNQIAGESDFLTFGEGEFNKTLLEEEKILESYQKTPNQIFILGEIEGEIAGILNVSAGARPRIQHIGTFGISVQKKFWGKGIGFCLMERMLTWAKENPIIRKIDLEVLTNNPRGIALYEKLGFEYEGRLKRHSFQGGKFIDTFAMGLLIEND